MAGPRTTSRPLFASRFGRRIFAVFVLCALGPIAALSALSWLRVTAELREQGARRLHGASRAAGMRILEHLVGAASALGSPGLDLSAAAPLPDRVAGLAIGGADRGWREITGVPVPVPALGPEERATLDARGSLFRIVERAGRRVPVLLVGRADGSWMAASLDEDDLFDASPDNSLPPEAEICVFDSDGVALRCSLPGSGRLPSLAPEREGLAAQPWRHADVDYFAVAWPVFLKANFQHPGLTVLVAEPEAAVYAPIAGFRTDLFLTTVLALFLVSLLSVQQIRVRLVPLERLRAGTRRIAESDFAARVEAEGTDELAELAASFNAMAGRLETQFSALEQVIEIDRGILSARNEEALAAAFLEPLERVYPCRFALVAVRPGEDGGPVRVHLRDGDAVVTREVFAPEGFAGWSERELPSQDGIHGGALPAFLEAVVPRAPQECVILPLTSGGEQLGLFVAGHDEERPASREAALYAKQLCDQLSAALYGTRLRLQNERLQRYDPLTGLPNDRWLAEQAAGAIAQAREGALVGLGRLAIEGLDRIRSTFGGEEVERVVRAVADLLRQQARVRAAHLSGGEFGLLVEGGDAAAVTRELRSALLATREIVAEDERGYLLSVRAGAAVAPLDGRAVEPLLRKSEAAQRHARDTESAELTFYAGEMNEALERRVRVESELARAVERGELRLYYQPIVDAATRRLVSAEALVRWQHPIFGLVGPDRFVPLAEEIGLIGAIGSWVLRAACAHLRAWQDARLPQLQVSVNVSAHQLRAEGLRAEVAAAVAAARIRPELLALELTESALMGEDIGIVETLHAIHRSGVSLSLDDFGTGYSSLAYLKRFPLDALKLDRVFVQGVTEAADKRAITEAVLAMARELGLRVVAEGVETEDQLRFLRERGCPLVQGYLFGAPMAEDAFRKLLAEQDAE